jgi:hypothetical protein
MTYTVDVRSGRWRIEPGIGGNWFLNRETASGWETVGIYKSAREAAFEFGTGQTAGPALDGEERLGAYFDLETWSALE